MQQDKEQAYDNMKGVALFLAQHGTNDVNGKEASAFTASFDKLKSAKFHPLVIESTIYHAIAMIKDGEESGLKQKSLPMIHYVQDRVNQMFNHDKYAEKKQETQRSDKDYTDKEKEQVGKFLASAFKLKRSSEHKDRYVMGEGYSTKTATGLFNTVVGIAEDIKSGKIISNVKSNSL
jgi:hypothetical protein